jgi:hypothetical protein
MPQKIFDGPIPGANFTSDTRNYPWHRPPELSKYDEIVDYYINKINEDETNDLVMTLLETNLPVTAVVSTLLKQGISKGKLGIDMAILTAGPIARYLSIVAEEQGIKHRVGIENRIVKITPEKLRAALLRVREAGQEDDAEAPEDTIPEAGLMQRPSPKDMPPAPADEQAQMLGEEPQDELA